MPSYMISLLVIITGNLFQRPRAVMPYKPGFEEDGILRSLAPFEPNEIELKARNCTEVSYSLSNTVTNGCLNLL